MLPSEEITLYSNDFANNHPRDDLLARPKWAVPNPHEALFSNHIESVANELVQQPGDTPPTLRYYVGAFHDFGKATAYFQEYIRDERTKSKWTNHSPLSAYAAFFALTKTDFDPVDQMTAWYAIYRHHGGMLDIAEAYDRALDQLPVLEEKAQALKPYREDIEATYESLDIQFPVLEFIEWMDSNRAYTDVCDALDYRGSVDPDDLPPDSAYRVIELYGRLISSDRLAASGFSTPDRRRIPESLVDQHVERSFADPEPGSINALREAARRTAEFNLRSVGIDTRRFTISLPTGLGKTLTGLHVATKLRKRVGEDTGMDPRIVYVLPYTAIIDQNHGVFADVYECATGNDPDPGTLLKHHHLSPGYHDDLDLELPFEKASLLDDRWESEIITTTYVQVIEGLLTPSSNQAIRFSNLSNAIFILDEPQSIPSRYWQLVDEALTWITDAWDSYVISMTATQPRVVQDKESSSRVFTGGTELIPGSKHFSDRLNRIHYRFQNPILPDSRGVTIQEFADRAHTYARENPNDDILVIANTISSAEETYHSLSRAIETDPGNQNVAYLSGHVRPIDRANRIAELTDDELEDVDRRIIVSTQVVETGVDIDVDYVLRDFAPLDTIVQAGGRCNRNNLVGSNLVEITQVSRATENETTRSGTESPSAQVYDAVKLDTTRGTLIEHENVERVSESQMLDSLLPSYFDKLPDRKELNANRDEIQSWLFEKGTVSLIDEEDEFEVFIEIDTADRKVLEKFTNALHNSAEGQLERRKAEFYERVVTVRENRIDTASFQNDARIIDEDRNIYAISLTDSTQSRWYDKSTGFSTT